MNREDLKSINTIVRQITAEMSRMRSAMTKDLDDIRQQLNRIEQAIVTPELPKADSIVFYIIKNGQKRRVLGMEKLAIGEEAALSLVITDKGGNDAPVDGAPLWSLDNADIGALDVAADGLSAFFKGTGKAGKLRIDVKADADLGEGVVELAGFAELEVLAGMAASLSLKTVVIKPVVEEPVKEEPPVVVEEPIVDAPVVDAPVIEEPVVEQPVEEVKPVDPVVEVPVAEEPVKEEIPAVDPNVDNSQPQS
jgi:hypothetical protein